MCGEFRGYIPTAKRISSGIDDSVPKVIDSPI